MSDPVVVTPVVPAPAGPGLASTMLNLLVAVAVFAGLAGGGVFLYDHFHGAHPAPPAPATLTIAGDLKVPQYGLAKLHLEGLKVDSAAWDVVYSPDNSVVINGESLDAAGNSYVFSGPPGNYRVTAWGVVSGKQQRASAVVTIDGPVTPPTPPSPPTPPTPTPPAPKPNWPTTPASPTGMPVQADEAKAIWASLHLAPLGDVRNLAPISSLEAERPATQPARTPAPRPMPPAPRRTEAAIAAPTRFRQSIAHGLEAEGSLGVDGVFYYDASTVRLLHGFQWVQQPPVTLQYFSGHSGSCSGGVCR